MKIILILNGVHTFTMFTFKQPKHVAAIYNWYITVLQLQIMFFYYMIEFRNRMLITKLNIAIHQDAPCGGMLQSIEKFQVSEFC